MLSYLFAGFSFAVLASAYQIITPGIADGWTTAGPNTVTWQRVNTDPATFTMVLVNQNQGVLPGGQQVLVATVDGTQNKMTVPVPSAGFPAGQGFQVNFVKDAQDLTTILAQSGQFAITQSSVTPSASSTGAAVTPANTVAQTTAQTAAQLTAQSAQSATGSSNSLNPTSSSTSKNGADRITAAGSTGLIFAALAVIAL